MLFKIVAADTSVIPPIKYKVLLYPPLYVVSCMYIMETANNEAIFWAYSEYSSI
jgi:hypothetical protein